MVWCPSVCLSHLPTAAACSGFAAVGPAGRRYRSVATRSAPQQHGATAWCAAADVGSVVFTADAGSSTETLLKRHCRLTTL